MRAATAAASSRRGGDAVVGLFQLQLVDQPGEAFAVFGQVDGIGAGAEDRNARIFQRLRQFQRCLPAELHDDADQLAGLLFDAQDFQHVFAGQRFEIKPVGSVVIGADGFGVAVDHDGLEPGFFQREAGMDAAIVELDALPDAVRPAAEDHDLAPVGWHRPRIPAAPKLGAS